MTSQIVHHGIEATKLKSATEEQIKLFTEDVCGSAAQLGYGWDRMLLARVHEELAHFGDWKAYSPGEEVCPSYLLMEFQSLQHAGYIGSRKLGIYPEDTLSEILDKVDSTLTQASTKTRARAHDL